MPDVGLSYNQYKIYLNSLIGKGLLKIEKEHLFKTTKKGLEFLEK